MTTWWNNNIETRMSDFKSWIGDFNQPSKIYCRNYIANKQYKSVIDAGCGLASDYFGFKNDQYEINYIGLDSCTYLVNLNKKHDIPMIEAELNADLPLSDNSYECVYCREVLEHLPYYEKTISEFVRIAAKEILIVFFIKPLEESEWEEEIKNKIEKQKNEILEERRKLNDARLLENPDYVPESEPELIIEIKEEEKEINYWKSEDLYHNRYDKKKLEDFIMSLPKVDKLFWQTLNDFSYVSIVDTDKNEDAQLTLQFDNKVNESLESKSTVKLTEELTNNKFVLHILLK